MLDFDHHDLRVRLRRSMLDFEALSKPLDPSRVRKREGGGGKEFSYIEGYDAIRTANQIFGYGNWGYRATSVDCVGEEEVDGAWFVAYKAVVDLWVGDVHYTAFADVGYGSAKDYKSRVRPHELASKEAVTDGVKRCLKNWGDQFGLCLYDKEAPEHDGVPDFDEELDDLKYQLYELGCRLKDVEELEDPAEELQEIFEGGETDLQDAAWIKATLAEYA